MPQINHPGNLRGVAHLRYLAIMRIEIFRQRRTMRLPAASRLKRIVQNVFAILHKPLKDSLSLAFVNDLEMAKLNKVWMKRVGPTDVLSFPGEGDDLGETVINYQEARRRSSQETESTEAIIESFVVHGVLSLLGLDHHGKNAIKMYKLEKKVLKLLGC